MKYKIPLFELNYNSEEENAIIETLRSKWISTGPKTVKFEENFSNMLGVKYALATSNCTVALHLALILAGVKKGDEVLCPSLTFAATVNAIRYVGAKPIFVDIKSTDDLNISPDDIKNKISKSSTAIIVMHYGGFACDMDQIIKIARENDLKIIEDACHGPSSEYNGEKLGTIGDIGCFSFFSNKNMSTGEGGMLVTNNRVFFEKAKLLRSHGMTTLSYERSKGHSTGYDIVNLGYNYRMDDIRASIGIVQLTKLAKDIMRRSIVRDLYIKYLKNINEIIIPFKDRTGFSSNYIFTIILNGSTRDVVRKELEYNGIQTSFHYPPVHKFSHYAKYTSLLPITDYVADRLITLPMYSNLGEEKIKYIFKSLNNAIINSNK
jgi:dTDP-4-amino-4,6-dideoxygalactose transaminase